MNVDVTIVKDGEENECDLKIQSTLIQKRLALDHERFCI